MKWDQFSSVDIYLRNNTVKIYIYKYKNTHRENKKPYIYRSDHSTSVILIEYSPQDVN